MSTVGGWYFTTLEWWEGTTTRLCYYGEEIWSPLSLLVWLMILHNWFIHGSYSISPNIREGLLEAFYGVYEKDPDKVYFLLCPQFQSSTSMPPCRTWAHTSYIHIYKLTFLWQVIQAMVQMGVLVPTGDLTSIRRTALFFLNRWFAWSTYLIYLWEWCEL